MTEAAIALSGLLLLILWGMFRHRRGERVGRKFAASVEQHMTVLMRKRRQFVRKDDYGIVDRSRWDKEIDYFLDKVVLKQLAPAEQSYFEEHRDTFRQQLDRLVEARPADPNAQRSFEQVRNGVEFEVFCAEELKKGGWQVTLTGASRDQGADIIAMRGRETIVVQCKLLNRPVGNYAVQEVVAARSYHNCDRSVVVSNQSFTSSAIELAATNDVLLCHWSELARL